MKVILLIIGLLVAVQGYRERGNRPLSIEEAKRTSEEAKKYLEEFKNKSALVLKEQRELFNHMLATLPKKVYEKVLGLENVKRLKVDIQTAIATGKNASICQKLFDDQLKSIPFNVTENVKKEYEDQTNRPVNVPEVLDDVQPIVDANDLEECTNYVDCSLTMVVRYLKSEISGLEATNRINLNRWSNCESDSLGFSMEYTVEPVEECLKNL